MMAGVRLLILGGTWFVGRAVAEAAVASGWQVTCFNRGRTGRDVDGVESVRGDRQVAADLVRLAEREPWDAVVDTGAYEPAVTRPVAEALLGVVGRYVIVSTVSAYQDWPGRPVDEDSPLWPARIDARETDADIAGLAVPVAYGTLKAGCEQVVRKVYGNRAVVLRPGVVLGPHEYVGRLEALLGRAARGGRMLVGGQPDRAIQPVDVRDLAAFVLRLVADDRGGTFNVVAPEGDAMYGELLATCVAATGAQTELVWVDPAWLAEQGVREWTELTLWRTPPGTWAVDGRRAREAGLICRPLQETVIDTWQWLRTERPVAHERRGEHGLDQAREIQLLAAWDELLVDRRR
jgi:2'-hydroxyisoflavone reductase